MGLFTHTWEIEVEANEEITAGVTKSGPMDALAFAAIDKLLNMLGGKCKSWEGVVYADKAVVKSACSIPAGPMVLGVEVCATVVSLLAAAARAKA